MIATPKEAARFALLTKRLRQVAALVACGFRSSEIALQLQIREEAVHAALTRIHRILGIDTNLRVAVYIVRHPDIERMLRESLEGVIPKNPS
jgi:DNA-binding NarL/FixJ family response regulator